MKTKTSYAYLFLLFILFFTQSCRKESAAPVENIAATKEDELAAGKTKLVLQPGPANGFDTWISWKQLDPQIYRWNWDTVDINPMYAWTSSGIPIAGRSLIKFTGLSAIPSSAAIVSAKLFLYGVPGSPHLPAGNSNYAGSPYPYSNEAAVLRITEDWQSSVVTWFKQPKITIDDSVHIPRSTAQWNWDVAVNVTEMVKKMVADPATNYGFELRIANETIHTCMQFSSSNYAIAERRPKLVVIYK